ncbi:nucleoside recognition domain-containing protein [Clostridium cylindrosporum]|uniref:Spore maturation protein A n=1 Tax=Clostridium cylindrosporum DSM 605 TaxID=1121307 RepID=A0A0J8DFB1_CLOCY|nr:nucleoside recognition domain-containing protein [Clostridium cylindrosporum]KMT22939.1 spore maturation protein A [Clostridium cylindrosporum DSM 605]
MINVIWFVMIVLGIISFLIKGEATLMVETIGSSAEKSIKLLVTLGGMMAVWSGIMKICQASSLVDLLSKALSLPMRFLFRGLYQKSPEAQGNIIMNIASNMMGLSNAATPFGIKAMESLQKINPNKERASDYMVTFLIVNSACIQFLPTTVISIRGSLGSANPSDIILPTILATGASLIIGLFASSLLRRFYR